MYLVYLLEELQTQSCDDDNDDDNDDDDDDAAPLEVSPGTVDRKEQSWDNRCVLAHCPCTCL